MAIGDSCNIWLSYGLVLVLLICCTITVMITPTESSSAVPLIRQRSETNATNGSRLVFPRALGPHVNETDCTPDYPVCSNVIDYPHELINDIVGRQKDRFAEVFGNDVVVENGDKLVQRFDGDENSNFIDFLCDSKEDVIHPKSGFNAKNESIIIVNTEVYKQGVRIETCRTHSEPCEKLSPLFGKTECRQIYHYRTLLAIDPKSSEPYKEMVKLPSCCKCVKVP